MNYFIPIEGIDTGNTVDFLECLRDPVPTSDMRNCLRISCRSKLPGAALPAGQIVLAAEPIPVALGMVTIP